MNIVIGITGSIAAYKAIDLSKLFISQGHKVKVVLSKGAEEFLNPNIFQYFGVEATYLSHDDFKNSNVLHIELTKWADKLLIAPLSANTLKKISVAECDDLLTSVFVAWPSTKPIIVAPAMNTNMYNHPFVQENLLKLKSLPNLFAMIPDSGTLACGDEGIGKLPKIEAIVDYTEIVHTKKEKFSKQNILITAGATIAPLDPVRFLTNPSTGLTGYHLAKMALAHGHNVLVVAGHGCTPLFENLKCSDQFGIINIHTAIEMGEAVFRNIENADCYISTAAISDIRFKTSTQKIKKKDIKDFLLVEHERDILQDVISLNRRDLKIIGFAAETQLTEQILQEKLSRKPVPLLIGTEVLYSNSETKGFEKDEANYLVMKNGKAAFKGPLSKKELAKFVIDYIGA